MRPDKHVLAVVSICMLVGLAYWNTLLNDFAFDDIPIIRDNALIRQARHLPTLFTTHYWEGAGAGGLDYRSALYRPLVLTTYMLNYLTTGLAAWAYHLTNLVLHLGVALTLYRVACRLALGWPGALAAALIFAVHPLNTEAVTGIVGRAELLMALGIFLALYWDLAKNPPENENPKLSFASLGAFTLALLSKEQSIMLPALLIVLDGMRTDRRGWQRWHILWIARKRYFGYLLVSALYVAVRIAALGLRLPPASNIVNPLGGIDDTLRVINAVKVAGMYLWLAVWPENLSADYSYNAITLTPSALNPAVLGSAAAWVLLLVLGTVAFFKRRRPLAVGIAITFLFFLPVSNIIVTIGTIMGERLFYLPLAGLCLAVGTAWNGLFEVLKRTLQPRWRGAVAVAAAILVLAPLAARTFARNRDWQNNETLFASIVRARPGSAKGHTLLARVYEARDELENALREHEQALVIAPDYWKVKSFARSYGELLVKMGNTEKGIAVMEASLETDPSPNPSIHRGLSQAYEQNGDLVMAAAARERAITIARRVPSTSTRALMPDYNHLARLYTLQGKRAEGRRALATALALVREDRDLMEPTRTGMIAEILGNMALIDALEEKYRAAERKYRRVLNLLESLDDVTETRIARLRDYARVLRKMEREEEASAIEREAASLASTVMAP